jgi:hypothetical protein
MLRKPGLMTDGEMDSVRLVGPSAPATRRGRDGSAVITSTHALRAHSAALAHADYHQSLSFSDSVCVCVCVCRDSRGACAPAVEPIGKVLGGIVSLGDRRAAERVGLHHVRARQQILPVNVDNLRRTEAEWSRDRTYGG